MQSLAEELYQRVTTRDDSRPKNYGDLPRPQENANFWFVGETLTLPDYGRVTR